MLSIISIIYVYICTTFRNLALEYKSSLLAFEAPYVGHTSVITLAQYMLCIMLPRETFREVFYKDTRQ
jgi:hypothetical protein